MRTTIRSRASSAGSSDRVRVRRPVRGQKSAFALWSVLRRRLYIDVVVLLCRAGEVLRQARIAFAAVAGKLRIGAERALHLDRRTRGIPDIFRGDHGFGCDAALDPLRQSTQEIVLRIVARRLLLDRSTEG